MAEAVNWRALIIRLERRRMRHVDIAAAVDRSERWVGQLKNSDIREPPWSVGQRLIALDRENVSRETQDVSVRIEISA